MSTRGSRGPCVGQNLRPTSDLPGAWRVLHRGRRASKSRNQRFGEPPGSASPSRAIRPNTPPGRFHDRGRCPLYVRAQLETAGLSWTQRDLAAPKATARETGNSQLTRRFRRWWQVLGSNQRRLSRRFYRPPIPTHRNIHQPCCFSISRRMNAAFCPCGVRSPGVSLVSATRNLDHVPSSPAESCCIPSSPRRPEPGRARRQATGLPRPMPAAPRPDMRRIVSHLEIRSSRPSFTPRQRFLGESATCTAGPPRPGSVRSGGVLRLFVLRRAAPRRSHLLAPRRLPPAPPWLGDADPDPSRAPYRQGMGRSRIQS